MFVGCETAIGKGINCTVLSSGRLLAVASRASIVYKPAPSIRLRFICCLSTRLAESRHNLCSPVQLPNSVKQLT